jgi:hypothetical protein
MSKWNLTGNYHKLENIYIKKLLDIVSSYPTNNGYIGAVNNLILFSLRLTGIQNSTPPSPPPPVLELTPCPVLAFTGGLGGGGVGALRYKMRQRGSLLN